MGELKTSFLYSVIFTLLISGIADAKTAGEALEVTKQNLKGHEALYNQGWFVITSTKDALEMARADSQSASQALSKALNDISKQTHDLSEDIQEVKTNSVGDAVSFHESGTKFTHQVFDLTQSAGAKVWKYSKEKYANAYSHFTLGYIELRKNNRTDWEKLKKVNSDFLNRTENMFDDTEMQMIMGDVYKSAGQKSEQGMWSKALTQAQDEFNQSYEESGKKGNSVSGLGSLLWGYCKAVYYGLFAPSGESLANGVRNAGPYLLGGTLATIKVAGDVVYTTGLNLFYSSKIGYNIISPTLEGGFLTSLGLVSTAAVPIVYAGGVGLGSINQVAVTSATPVYGTGQFILASTAKTATHSAIMVYDFAKGAGQTLMYESKAMVVIGYNMLTAIPAQSLLGVADGVVFLVYDGPHLALMSLRGEIDGVSVGEIPVGTVLDGKALEQKGLKLEKVTDDPTVIQKVLEAAPKDMQRGNSK